ncbi:phosphotransferase [Pullulanibacillus sp. KACC 23026]|uniref:phosphotransferase n=1 Tax=Pullulanibacillus sp. KACC 23026 TaxID=3028315 RepID=UPI0023B123B6|nr:phosphotransferase [Pullulanibacillus sp. KACC 23026]WEG14043.1 phosphotransferase [Pullulanibacillus sp. KACC 23026]
MSQTNAWRDLDLGGHVSSFYKEPHEEIPSSVFSAYELNPQMVRVISHGRVWYIEDQGNQYALKRIALTHNQLRRFLSFYQASRQSPIQTPALILNSNGQPYSMDGRDIYFLTEWLSITDRDQSDQWEMLWDTLGDWHRLTAQSFELEAAWREAFIERCLEVWSEQVLSLDLFMNDCEHRLYPSPFEQRFMAIFSEIRSGAEEAHTRMKNWQDQLSEKKQIRVVSCHGKPSTAHLIVSGRRRNWISTDQSGIDLPVRDLLWLLRWGQTTVHPEALKRGFDIYETIFPLDEHEKTLLSAHLCQPASLVRLLHQYKQSRKSQLDERGMTINLEKAYHHWGRTWQATRPLLDNKPQSPSESDEKTGKD